MRLTKIGSLALAIFAASTASADVFGCDHVAQRRAALPSDGITNIVVIGRAGSLKVTGRPGAREVLATGKACASDKDFLEDIQITARRDGNEIRVEAVIPERTMIFNFYEAKLDLEVIVPSDVPVRVTDGSGSVHVDGTGAVSIRDGSGEIDVQRVHGNVDIRDGSGSVEIRDVTGNVSIVDGSGGVEVENVRGSVIIEADGSGGIDVEGVSGDFIVKSDGSGGVSHARIAGKVKVPKD